MLGEGEGADMDLSSARDEFAARGFDGLAPARANLFLNAGRNALEDYASWPWLETSTSGTAPLTIADLKTVQFVYRTAPNLSIDGADRSYLRQMYGPNLTIVGTAVYWYLDGVTTLKLFPVDTTTINVDYLMQSPELVNDSDEPEWPDVAALNQAWIDLACVEAYEDADEGDRADKMQIKANTKLNGQIDKYLDRNHQNAEQQAVTFASEDW